MDLADGQVHFHSKQLAERLLRLNVSEGSAQGRR